jgi:crotonobetainyl-CoA:carnitine CoA-transferase CaiB-like acyl-CoA transferase
MEGPNAGPLADLRVIDCSTLIAAPGCARYLADFGADVLKVERPDGGDSIRGLGWRDPSDGETLWSKLENRNKRCITLDLKSEQGKARFLDLCADAHVLIENFRTGTLERLGFGPDVLHARNPGLVITRVSGFGQDGPYASRPGFATLAEAMSGFASVNGEPNGAPLLPPIALADDVTALAAAFATMVAVHSGVGQVVDVSLLDSMLQIMGPLPTLWATLGQLQPRLGAGLPYSVPRNTFCCRDGRWVAISTSSEPIAARVMALVGLGGDPRVATSAERAEHRELVDGAVANWIGARDFDEVLAGFHDADAAIAPVLTMADLAADSHIQARQSLVEVDGVLMQNVVARLSKTPGRVRWAGRPLGADNEFATG